MAAHALEGRTSAPRSLMAQAGGLHAVVADSHLARGEEDNCRKVAAEHTDWGSCMDQSTEARHGEARHARARRKALRNAARADTRQLAAEHAQSGSLAKRSMDVGAARAHGSLASRTIAALQAVRAGVALQAVRAGVALIESEGRCAASSQPAAPLLSTLRILQASRAPDRLRVRVVPSSL